MTVHVIQDPVNGGSPVIADRPLYADASGTKLVEEGDAAAAVLVVSHAGKPIPSEFVQSLRLEVGKGGKVRQAGGDKERRARLDKDATPPVDDGTKGAPIISAGASAVLAMSVSQLKALAKERGVPGYSGMNKEELQAAIVEGGEMQAGGLPDADD